MIFLVVFLLFRRVIAFIATVLVFIALIFLLGFILNTFNLQSLGNNLIIRFVVMMLIFLICGYTYRKIVDFRKADKKSEHSTDKNIIADDEVDNLSEVHYDLIEKTAEKPGFPLKEYNNMDFEKRTENLENNSSHDDSIKSKNYGDMNVSSKVKSESGISDSIKIVVGFIVIVMLVFIGLFTVGMFGNDDMVNTTVFSDSNVSFEYPSDWVHGNDSDFSLVLEGDNIALYMNISSDDGYSIDNMVNNVLIPSKGLDVKLIYKNVTNVDGVKAYDIGFDINKDGGFHSRILTFIANDKLYILAFNYENIGDIDDYFNLIKNSIKIK